MGAKKILIIDDEPDTVVFLGTYLQDMGYVTCSASDGIEGMRILEQERPDLVLMDLKMPNQTGLGLYRAIVEHEGLRGLPVIFITGVGAYHLFSRGCEKLPEPAACLTKPVDLVSLRRAIEQIFG